jgi:hypothetical protein
MVNTLGHCAGAIVFGMLLYYLGLDWKRNRAGRSPLPCVAAILAMLWNLGSLVGLATAAENPVSEAIVAFSFSVLSVLPAVLLRIFIGPERSLLCISGYVTSGVAVCLHIADLVTDAARFHYAAILLVTIGFGTLAALELAREIRTRGKWDRGRRLAGAMGLFLLAVSFAHFRSDHDAGGWSGEAALHHAAIPLALFVLLQDYRFVLADAFIRFLSSAVLAGLTVLAAWRLQLSMPIDAERPFQTGLLFVAACLLISLFAFARGQLQRALTRIVFLRQSGDQALSTLREVVWSVPSESAMLREALVAVRNAFSAQNATLMEDPAGFSGRRQATTFTDSSFQGLPDWVQAVAPLRFARGDVQLLLLGSRAGGRRYLSEDIELLNRIAAIICERVEQVRSTEMQTLVSQAELRALQAQINPHFFFNSLNTLYGVIPREAAAARRLVLNVADLFRMSLTSRSTVRIEEEIRLVRAYLDIEQVRLGAKLGVTIEVDDSALFVEIPALSIQPLVENAIKHGVAPRAEGGFVRISIKLDGDAVRIEVVNSGRFQPDLQETKGMGVGLENVRRRLALSFGDGSQLEVDRGEDTTSVRFSVPATVPIAGNAV